MDIKNINLSNDPTQPKTFIYQRWWFWVILASVLMFVFYRCTSDLADKDKSNIGTAYIEIESFRISENYDDPIIIVKYKYTNYNDEPEAFVYSVSTKAFQNDIELDTLIFVDDDTGYQADIKRSDVYPGKTITVEVAYKLRDLTSNVTILVTNFAGIGNESIRRTFDIKALADEVLGNMNSEGSIGNVYVKIDSFRIVKNYNDKLIIVKYIFTNNSEEATSFSYSISDNAYQNGIELDEVYFVSSSANYSYDNQGVKIQPGITLEVEVAYELRDETSDVLIELSKYSGKKITKTFTIN